MGFGDVGTIKEIKGGFGSVGKNIDTTIGGFGMAKTEKLDNSQSLYNLASKSGFQADADRVLSQHTGEETKKIFSGGFISDIFDTLNTLQYGVTGILKGKGFAEGVKTRQSFSDKDALGDKGLPGVVAGIALDIAVDPLTYIAPWTVLKKISPLMKAGQAAKAATFGKMVEKTIETPEGVKKFSQLEGGNQVGKWFADKFVYMFGKDPIYKEAYERSVKNIAVGTQNVADMAKGIANLTPDVAKKLLTKDATGRFKRVGIDELQKILTPEEFTKVQPAWQKIDDLGKQAVDLGLLNKTKYEEGLGEYIKNAYTDYELVKSKGLFGFTKVGVKGIKSRKTAEELASGYLKSLDINEVKKLYPDAISLMGKISLKGLKPEVIQEIAQKSLKELGQIDNPAYLLFKSVFDLQKDIENAKLFKVVSKQFGSDVIQEGFKQLPKTQKLVTTGGLQAGIMIDIKNINQKLKPAFASLKQTFKADKTVLSEIHQAEKTMSSFGKMRAEEFIKFFQEGEPITKISKATRRIGTLPEDLVGIAEKVKKFNNLDDVLKSDIGFELEKLYQGGILERRGFKTMKSFFDYAKEPFKKTPEVIKEITAKGNLSKLIKLQSQIEKLSQKAGKLGEVDKRSIDDAFRFWEETISKLSVKKENLIEQLGKVRLGDLSGKFVPENIFNAIQDITEPIKDTLGKKLIANFKFFKVVMNPATHARNIMSNSILNWWKLGLGPWRADIYLEALGQIRKGGKWIDEAKTVGYNVNTFAANEIKSILDNPEALGLGGKIGGKWANIKNKLSDIYQGEENMAKLSAFIFKRKQGLGIEEAWKAAESATFNYAQVTPFVRKLRTALWGYPFITFTIKSAPIAIETALKAPHRISVFGKIKNDIENLSDIKETERERASEPQWIKDGFYIKLPVKDKLGRSAYFDLTYIIPFGDIVSGQLFGRQVKRETGTLESVPEALASNAPAFGLLKEISRNQNFYGDKIWNDSDTMDKQLGDLMRHITKTYLPPLVADQMPGGYMKDGTRRQKGFIGALKPQEKESQQRTLMEEMLRQVGAKIQPIDADIQETYQEWNKKKALQILLKEKGVIKDFTIPYVPKK